MLNEVIRTVQAYFEWLVCSIVAETLLLGFYGVMIDTSAAGASSHGGSRPSSRGSSRPPSAADSDLSEAGEPQDAKVAAKTTFGRSAGAAAAQPVQAAKASAFTSGRTTASSRLPKPAVATPQSGVRKTGSSPHLAAPSSSSAAPTRPKKPQPGLSGLDSSHVTTQQK